MRKEIDRKALYFIGQYDYVKTLKIAIGTFSWPKSVGRGVQLHETTSSLRHVTRSEYDGTVTVLVDKFDGKPLTDPPFGILNNYDGQASTPETPTNVCRLIKPAAPRSRAATSIDRTDSGFRPTS